MNIEGVLLSEWYCLIHPLMSRLHIIISSCDSPWSFEHYEWREKYIMSCVLLRYDKDLKRTTSVAIDRRVCKSDMSKLKLKWNLSDSFLLGLQNEKFLTMLSHKSRARALDICSGGSVSLLTHNYTQYVAIITLSSVTHTLHHTTIQPPLSRDTPL